MSQWEEIVRNVLRKNHISLDEATIIRTDYYNNFNDGDKLIVIKNPSKEEYDNIKKNSKYNSVRGFVTKDDSVYVWDANLGIHQDVISVLDDENKKPYDVALQFSQDENNNITVNSSFDSKRLNDLLDYKKSKYSNTNTLNAKDISNLNYYDFEVLYNGIYKKENEIIQEFANSYSYEYNFDFSKLDYDNKPYNEKDDFKTFMKKAKQIIAKENNINLDEAKQVGSLYHCTNIDSALKILNANVLFSARSLGVSTSRSLNLFKKGYGEVCIELDGDKLSNKYRILPTQYGREDSQEELIQDKKLTPYKSIEDYHTVHQTIGFKKFEQLDRDYWEYTGDPDIGFTIKGMSIPNILNYIKAIYITPKRTEYSSSTQVEELLKKCSALHIDTKLLDINTERTRAGGVMTKLPTTDRELYNAKGNYERAEQYRNLANKTKVLYNLLQEVFPDIKLQISPNKDSYNFIISKNAKSKNFDFNAYINENTIGEKNVLKIKENNTGYLLTFNPNSIILPSHIGLARIPTQFKTYDLCLQKVSEERTDGEDNNNIKYVPKQFEDYKMFATALKHWHADLYQIPEQFKDKNMYLIEYSKYGELKVIPDKFKTYDLCLDAVNKSAYNLKAVPDQLKDQKISMLAFEKDSDMLEYIPDKFKTHDMCIKAVEDGGYNIAHVPEQFITQDLCLNIIKKNPHHIKYIPQKFKTYDICSEALKNVSGFYQDLYLRDEVPEQFKDKIRQELNIES